MSCRRWCGLVCLLATVGSVWAIGPLDDSQKKLVRKVWYFPSRRPQRMALGYMNQKNKFIVHGYDVYFYDVPGQVKSMGFNYRDGVKNGTYKAWYPDGKLRQEGRYDDGKRSGVWMVYFESGGKKQQVPYEVDERSGPFKEWDEKGNLIAECTYVNDQRQGQEFRYYPDGTKQSSVYWVDGKLDGQAQSWYPDGKPKQSTTFSKGKKNGELTEYYPNGNLRMRATYVMDVLSGAYEAHTPDGTMVGRGAFLNGKIEEGTFRDAGMTDNQYWMDVYKDGKIVDGTLYEDGKPKTGEVQEFYPGGKPLRLYLFKAGKRYGPEVWWYESGQIEKEMTWKDNHIDGTYTEYWPSGKQRWIMTVKDGVKVGVETRWDHRGNTVCRGEYRNGEPWDGSFVVPLEDGTDMLKVYKNGVLVSSPEDAREAAQAQATSDDDGRRWKVSAHVLSPEESANVGAHGGAASGTAPVQPSPIQ